MNQCSACSQISDRVIPGISGVPNSLGYRVAEIEHHFHSPSQTYGNTANQMAADVPVKFTVVGGDNAWGTELMLTDGTVIEGGSATKKFDLNLFQVVDVSTANKISAVHIEIYQKGTALASVVITDATDKFTLAGHGLVNGNKVILSSIVTSTGVNAYTVYYVVGMSGNDFQLSLTEGGAAVVIGGGNGTCTVTPLTVTTDVETKLWVSKAATNADISPSTIQMPRAACNSVVSIRAKSATGSTISIGFLLGLHTYLA